MFDGISAECGGQTCVVLLVLSLDPFEGVRDRPAASSGFGGAESRRSLQRQLLGGDALRPAQALRQWLPTPCRQ